MQQINIQLYGRMAKTEFSEDLSARQSVPLSPDPSTVELSLNAPEGQSFVEARIDPADKPCSFILLDLKIFSRDQGAEIYRWDGNPDSLGVAVGIEFREEIGQVVVDCLTDDPFILLPLSEPHQSLTVHLRAAELVSVADEVKLAGAVRSLQASLRFALDDLANEQEGLQEALLLHRTHSHNEGRIVNDRLSEVLGKTAALDAAVSGSATQTREVLLQEVRDDWRSLRRQIEEVADKFIENSRARDVSLSAKMQAEFAKLEEAMNRSAASQEVMYQLRRELGVIHNDDAVAKVRQLKSEVDAARAQLRTMKRSLAWRLTHPFANPESRD